MDPGSACTHNPSPREMKFPRDPWASLLPDHGGPSILSEVRPGTGESLAADPDTHRKVVGFPKRPGRPSRPPFPGVANTKISQERSLVPGGNRVASQSRDNGANLLGLCPFRIGRFSRVILFSRFRKVFDIKDCQLVTVGASGLECRGLGI